MAMMPPMPQVSMAPPPPANALAAPVEQEKVRMSFQMRLARGGLVILKLLFDWN